MGEKGTLDKAQWSWNAGEKGLEGGGKVLKGWKKKKNGGVAWEVGKVGFAFGDAHGVWQGSYTHTKRS